MPTPSFVAPDAFYGLPGPSGPMLGFTEGFWQAVIAACLVAVTAITVELIRRPSRKNAKENDQATKEIKAQLENNGGSTVKDAIDRIDKRTKLTDDRSALMDRRQLTMEERQLGIESSVMDMHRQLIDVVHTASSLVDRVHDISGEVKQVVNVTLREMSEELKTATTDLKQLTERFDQSDGGIHPDT